MIRKALLLTVLIACLTAFLSAEKIANIVITGNSKISEETILFYMKSQKNGPYSRDLLVEDFQSLWETGFFSNIEFRDSDSPQGKIITVMVEENPTLASVTYNTGRRVKEKDITEKLQEESLLLSSSFYITPVKLKKVKTVILDLLRDKGFYNGTVEIIQNEQPGNALDLVVNVENGPKTRVGDVIFTGIGDRNISSGFLKKGIKNNKEHNLVSTILGKDVFQPAQLSEDLEELKLRFKQKGFVEARIGKPRISMKNGMTLFGSRVQKMVTITIPVDPGPQYIYQGCSVEGNEIVKTDYIKSLITLEKNDIYNEKEINENIQEIHKVYQNMGYLSSLITPEKDLDPEKKHLTLRLKVHEGEIAYLNRLSFVGNTYTKDRVLRRQFFLREGRRIRAAWLEDSIRRMKQLGLVDIADPPFKFKQNPDEPQQMDLEINVTEMHRQMINFQSGYSGYNGLFLAVGYSTKNFLGVGESLSINLSHGERLKNYQLSFTEPRLFHLPINVGFNLFKTDTDYYGYFKRKTAGFSLFTYFRFWRYWGGHLTYRYSQIDEDEITEIYYPYFYFNGIMSTLAPTIYYNTVDSPIFPTSGTKVQLDYGYSGGFLGGDVNTHKFTFTFVNYLPIHKGKTLGVQFRYMDIIQFGEGSIPRTERIYLGGERSIRGFQPYAIGPRNSQGYSTGGAKGFHLNVEFHLPLSKEISFIPFYDIGNSYQSGDNISLDNIYQSMGAEVKIFIPMLNVPFRLIFAYNPRLLYSQDSHFVFRLGVGPSFY